MALRDAGELLAPAVAATITELKLARADDAAARLAMYYAEAIDQAAYCQRLADDALAEIDPDDIDARLYVGRLKAALEVRELLDKLGPKLLAALESLGATPAARARIKDGGKPAGDTPNRLRQLREASRA